MADVFASAGAGGHGHMLQWTLDFDDTANTVTIDATHTKFDGSPAVSDPQVAKIRITLNSSVDITVNLLTGLLEDDQGVSQGPFVQGSPTEMVNAGPRTRTGVRVKVSANRAAALQFSTLYTPPS